MSIPKQYVLGVDQRFDWAYKTLDTVYSLSLNIRKRRKWEKKKTIKFSNQDLEQLKNGFFVCNHYFFFGRGPQNRNSF